MSDLHILGDLLEIHVLRSCHSWYVYPLTLKYSLQYGKILGNITAWYTATDTTILWVISGTKLVCENPRAPFDINLLEAKEIFKYLVMENHSTLGKIKYLLGKIVWANLRYLVGKSVDQEHQCFEVLRVAWLLLMLW